MAGYGPGFFDFDNDGWKDLFVTRGHVEYMTKPGTDIEQYNTVFRNPGATGQWQALTAEAGLDASPAAGIVGARLVISMETGESTWL